MFAIVLYQPEIPPNTGNIVRLCAVTGCALHLVEPLGFRWNDKALVRAGLDYQEYASVIRHRTWADCRAILSGHRLFALTTKGTRRHDAPTYTAGDVFVFGSETRGLPDEVLADIAADQRLRLPMLAERRSLNLSNAAAVMVYEAWRQLEFAGTATLCAN